MRFSGKKKKRRGFGRFAGGSTRGTPESHVPGRTGGKLPGMPGIPGMPGMGGLPAGPKPQQREPLYGRKVVKKSSHTPLIIIAIIAAVVVACIVIAISIGKDPHAKDKAEINRVVQAVFDAVSQKKPGALYDNFSKKLTKVFEKQLEECRKLKGYQMLAVFDKLGIDSADLKRMTGRDWFILIWKEEEEATGKHPWRELDGVMEVLETTVNDDQAKVAVHNNSIGKGGWIHLKKEKGCWKLYTTLQKESAQRPPW